MLEEARVVVCTSLVAGKVRSMAPEGTEIIGDDRTLNQGGLEMLRQRLMSLMAGGPDKAGQRGRR
ncbi:MAG TPA: hypothetical protein VLH58_09190 [Candidatus Methylomirabilis sp.]|nr:hypothetical protein [Candidatus Methylomirabilis sp.]HSC71515.1 hypothetical protein [Candidatus Methylomirabilis sp.]